MKRLNEMNMVEQCKDHFEIDEFMVNNKLKSGYHRLLLNKISGELKYMYKENLEADFNFDGWITIISHYTDADIHQVEINHITNVIDNARVKLKIANSIAAGEIQKFVKVDGKYYEVQ